MGMAAVAGASAWYDYMIKDIPSASALAQKYRSEEGAGWFSVGGG